MRPVPRFAGSGLKDSRPQSQRHSSPGLQWRTSSRVASQTPAATLAANASAAEPAVPASANMPSANHPTTEAVAVAPVQPLVHTAGTVETAEGQSTIRIVSAQPALQAAANRSAHDAGQVQQVRYQDSMDLAQGDNGFQLPPALGLKSSSANATPAAPALPAPGSTSGSATQGSAAPALPDFFSNPFADDVPSDAMPEQQAQPQTKQPPVAPEPANGLRAPQSGLNQPEAPAIEEPMESAELETEEAAEPEAPTPTAPNPFDRTRQPRVENPPGGSRNLEDFELPAPRSRQRDSAAEASSPAESEEIRRSFAFSCDEFRKSIAEATIQKVSLDISPPFRPDVIELDEFEKLKNKFNESQEVRDWSSIDGKKMGRGKLIDLAYEKVVIETEFGTQEELPINRISEADLAYLSKNWGLPQECLIEQAAYVPRNWQSSTVTWKASNLCHKPLYFEEVNLERYGHTAGPFVQPIVSSAHFFVNIAVMPYKMGVHAPTECQYTLGYYRPGNCAPWIVPPVPLSLRGTLYQAAAVTGGFWLIP